MRPWFVAAFWKKACKGASSTLEDSDGRIEEEGIDGLGEGAQEARSKAMGIRNFFINYLIFLLENRIIIPAFLPYFNQFALF